MHKLLVRCIALLLIPCLLADLAGANCVTAFTDSTRQQASTSTIFVSEALTPRVVESPLHVEKESLFLRHTLLLESLGMRSGTWVARLYERLPGNGRIRRLLRVAVGGFLAGAKETLMDLALPLLSLSISALFLSAKEIASGAYVPGTLSWRLERGYLSTISTFQEGHRTSVYVGSSVTPLAAKDMKTPEQQARWNALQDQIDTFSETLASPFAPFLAWMPSVFVTLPMGLLLSHVLHLSLSASLATVLAALTPVLLPGLISAWRHIGRNSGAIWSQDPDMALAMKKEPSSALDGERPVGRRWTFNYEVRGRDVGANRPVSEQVITPFVDLRDIQTYLPELNRSIAHYRKLREEHRSPLTELMGSDHRALPDIMEPLDKPIGVFDGNLLTPGIRAVSVGSPLVGLNRIALAKEGESPWLAVFCLRHAAARRISVVPYWDTVFDDAEFIRILKPAMTDAEYENFLTTLETLLDSWPDKSGYLEMLRKMSSGRLPTDNDKAIIRDYLETKLIQGSEPAIWEVTLDADMVRLLQARLGQKDGGLVGDLVFESLLARAGALSLESRAFIRRVIKDLEDAQYDPGLLGKVQAEHVRYVEAHSELIQVLADVSRVAIKIYSPLNAAVGLDNQAEEQFAYLDRLAAEVNRILGETDQPRQRRVLTDNAIERLDWRVRYLLQSPAAPLEVIAQELVGLAGDPEFAQEAGRLLANIHREFSLQASSPVDRLANVVPAIHDQFSRESMKLDVKQDLDDLVNQIAADHRKNGLPLSTRKLSQLESIAASALAAYVKPRKDERPYIVHPMAVVRTLHRVFRIVDRLLDEAGLLHDTFEDVEDAYLKIMEEIRRYIGPEEDSERYHTIALYVRMVTFERKGGESEREAMIRYYRGIIDPRTEYGDQAPLNEVVAASFYTNARLRKGQLLKLADVVSNWRDFPWFFDETIPITDKLRQLPARAFNKTFRYVIPLLVNNPDNKLTQEDVEAFYGALTETLCNGFEEETGQKRRIPGYVHALIHNRYPRAGPLVEAAQAAVPRLLEGILKSPHYAHSDELKRLARELQGVHLMGSISVLNRSWEKLIGMARAAAQYSKGIVDLFASPTHWIIQVRDAVHGSIRIEGNRDQVWISHGLVVRKELEGLKSPWVAFDWLHRSKRLNVFWTAETLARLETEGIPLEGTDQGVQYRFQLAKARWMKVTPTSLVRGELPQAARKIGLKRLPIELAILAVIIFPLWNRTGVRIPDQASRTELSST